MKDGGPAFPAVIPIEHSDMQGKDYPNYSESGMTLRDWFAGQALADNCGYPTTKDTNPTNLVREAYAIADAMLAEREK